MSVYIYGSHHFGNDISANINLQDDCLKLLCRITADKNAKHYPQ